MLTKIWLKILRYLAIFIPMSLLLLVPMYLYGDELGLMLIAKFGNAIGLYIRPIVMASTYIIVLVILMSPKLEKFNSFLWLNKLDYEEIKNIYRAYIYGIGSFALLTLLIILNTIFFHSANGVNWFNAKDYLFVYFLVVLFALPFFTKKSVRDLS